MKSNENQRGFSLIELLIVVAIIGIIAAIAVPKLVASRRAANEGSAISSLRTIYSAQATYAATGGSGRYGTLATLGGQDFIDSVLGTGSKSGYTFDCDAANLTLGPPPGFFVTSIPSDTSLVSRTGNRSFTVADDGLIRGKITDTAAANYNEATDATKWPPAKQ